MALFCKLTWTSVQSIIMIDPFFFPPYSIVGRIKDIFKTPAGRQISPSQVEDVLLNEPQGLITDAIVAGVMPRFRSKDELKGEVPRAWIVLSDEGKKLGADVVIKELEVWLHNRLNHHKWLHGGIEIVDEVCMAVAFKKKNNSCIILCFGCRFPRQYQASHPEQYCKKNMKSILRQEMGMPKPSEYKLLGGSAVKFL